MNTLPHSLTHSILILPSFTSHSPSINSFSMFLFIDIHHQTQTSSFSNLRTQIQSSTNIMAESFYEDELWAAMSRPPDQKRITLYCWSMGMSGIGSNNLVILLR